MLPLAATFNRASSSFLVIAFGAGDGFFHGSCAASSQRLAVDERADLQSAALPA